jgi:hypothetical protein
MPYTKPEVMVLGNARALIELIRNQKTGSSNDSPGVKSPPAYDLDE